ncbi:hypothetical protein BDB00DRAFT_857093, partial [Zychaea mexicana]|uniref:uncharacterized protein n=1 Tax=Zychaea mexicana TaxID=64656 RepID=UPI0022FF09BE
TTGSTLLTLLVVLSVLDFTLLLLLLSHCRGKEDGEEDDDDAVADDIDEDDEALLRLFGRAFCERTASQSGWSFLKTKIFVHTLIPLSVTNSVNLLFQNLLTSTSSPRENLSIMSEFSSMKDFKDTTPFAFATYASKSRAHIQYYVYSSFHTHFQLTFGDLFKVIVRHFGMHLFDVAIGTFASETSPHLNCHHRNRRSVVTAFVGVLCSHDEAFIPDFHVSLYCLTSNAGNPMFLLYLSFYTVDFTPTLSL